MALDNTQTIDLGDGKTVQIPEFATEKTLQQLVVALKKAGMTIDADAKASKNVNKTLEKQAKQLELQFKEEKKQRAKGDLEEKKQSEKIIEKLDKGNAIDKANQGVLKKALDNIDIERDTFLDELPAKTTPPQLPRESTTRLTSYEFVNVWPTNMTSMRVAYGDTNVLRCSVQFAYDRFFTSFNYLDINNAVESTYFNSVSYTHLTLPTKA